MDFFSVGVGFVAGLIVYRIFVEFLGLSHAVRFFREIEKHCIMVLASATESIAYIQQIKYNSMIELGLSEQVIKTTKNVEEHNFELWKAAVIASMASSYPKHIKPAYKDWEEALQILDKIYRKKRT
jgi:hypothetical protein